MQKEINIKIKKISNGYLLNIEHDIFYLSESFYPDITYILTKLKDVLEGLY